MKISAERRRSADIIRQLMMNIVPAGVLSWALAMLTATYLGYATNVDAAFISSLVTTVLASYGISRVEQVKKRDTNAKIDKSKDNTNV